MSYLITIFVIIASATNTTADIFAHEQIDPTHHYYGESLRFEDGSFIEGNVGGCVPFMMCSTIGIDTPWEDMFANKSAVQCAYDITDMYKNSMEKFKDFAPRFSADFCHLEN